ncbi:MAG: hypothetical protein ACREB8_17315 [Pseudolabrys sp.]
MEYAQLPGTWRDLYLMLGTSSAALIGLLFVASTLHVREIVSVELFKVRVQNTMLVMTGTLIQATAILTPQPLRFLGIELLLLNLWGLWFPLSLLYRASKMSATARGGFSIYRGIFFTSGYLIGIAGTIALTMGATWGMYLATVCYLNCLVAGIWNAWMMMLGIGQGERKQKR